MSNNSSIIIDSTNDKDVNSNIILLTLPNVSLVENESEESDKNCCNAGECTVREPAAEVINRVKQFKGECESVAYSAVDEGEYFRHQQQQLLNKDRLSPELQDVYKLLMQLPSFSHSSWSGFNSAAGHKATTTANMRKVGSLGKTRKGAFTTGKVGRFYKDSTSSTSGTIKEMDTLSNGTRNTKEEDMKPESKNKQPTREIVRMHSINLYQSILPSSLFARRKI